MRLVRKDGGKTCRRGLGKGGGTAPHPLGPRPGAVVPHRTAATGATVGVECPYRSRAVAIREFSPASDDGGALPGSLQHLPQALPSDYLQMERVDAFSPHA